MERLIGTLAKLPPEDRACEALILSSKLIEFAAFESATWLPSARVAELIGWSVKLGEQSHALPAARSAPPMPVATRMN
ncbi:MAG: hypothetical protein AAF636_12065 [Pseudomonadota bacterium]